MNFFKKYFFLEAQSLVTSARTRLVTEDDMLQLPKELDPRENLFDEAKLSFKSPFKHLISTLVAGKKEMIPAFLWYLLSTCLALLTPYLVNRFINLIEKGVNDQNLVELLWTAFLLGLSGFMSVFFLQHYFYRELRSYQVIVNILNRRIFQHSLKLTIGSRQKNMLGDIVNFMGTDSESVADFGFVFFDLVMNIITIIGVVVMLFIYLGNTAFYALAILLLLFPLTKIVAKKFTSLDEEMMQLRDKRVTLMGQVLNSIRVVKYFSWEESIEKEVMNVREKELLARKKLARSEVLSGLAYMSVSTIVLFIALYTYYLQGHPLSAALVFTCVSLFGLLEGPFGDMSHLISRMTNGYVGARRILSFLEEETLTRTKVTNNTINDETYGIHLNNVQFQYHQDAPVIKNINLNIHAKEAVAIVGAVGAGKSTFLLGLLQELPESKGLVQFKDSDNHVISAEDIKIAFLPQEAYIVNSSLRENLLFGEELQDDVIFQALYQSAFDQDLNTLSAGLETEIGEKGVNLSGGQKQRVGLARAYLSNPQIVFLDDPLSAVDGETEDKLIERLIFGSWNNKTRIVVTHRLKHLKRFQKVIFIKNGVVEEFGHVDELLAKSESFREFYREDTHLTPEENSDKATKGSDTVGVTTLSEQRITEDEDREVGAVKKRVYTDYLLSLGGDHPKIKYLVLFFLVLSAILVSLAPLMQKSWLSYFSTHQNEVNVGNAVLIYGCLGLFALFMSVMNNFFWLERGIKAGKRMHDEMLRSVLRSPIRFFDSTPVGRILQRFSRDVESVDIYLQWSFVSVVHSILQVIVSLFLIIFLIPWMIVIIVPVMLLYYRVQNDYRRPAREVKRFDSVARSPRYAHFKETLQGLVVIRGFKKEAWFLNNFYERLAYSQRMFYSHYMLNRWFSSRIPLIGGMISLSTAMAIALATYYGMISSGNAALLTVYSLSFWGYLNWGVRQFADIESRMTSIERLKYFARLPAEVDESHHHYTEGQLNHWPSKGEIEVNNLFVRYAEHLPTVLKGVSFKVNSGERVGIIGRTGSGKSTLFQALYRFIEPYEGHIKIDGVDIRHVPLKLLRKKMAIIPQDPTLFMGTIRSNLDRFHEFSDTEVNNALKQTGLLDFVHQLPHGLNFILTEGGANLSQGQRQLLCMARALLIGAKIIVMDEATASVDLETDAMLQKVIREELKGVTILVIAHRLSTVHDSDQIIELKNGQLMNANVDAVLV